MEAYIEKKALFFCVVGLLSCCVSTLALARADKTAYPVIFAHGMMGFDQLLGIDYFGNDYGVFVGDPCDQFLETSCNREIDRKQKAYATDVNPFQSSEYRGLELADEIESYMATVDVEHVNIVGHSQGGLDARKAAKLLYDRTGHQVVKTLISISSPHRGSAVAGNVLTKGEDGYNAFTAWLVNNVINSILYVEKGDFFASMKAFFYDDWDPNDGEITGAKAFNNKYPMDNTYVDYYGSLITAEPDILDPVLIALRLFASLIIDGDGWCGATDENGDMIDCQGDRLTFNDHWLWGTYISVDKSTGYVSNLNQITETQATSNSSVLPVDHVDICGTGFIPYLIPDNFDDMEFYADVIDYIAGLGN
jgi:triacylglycerol lipase